MPPALTHCTAWAFALATTLAASPLRAQSSCSSDGQPRPVALLERFINADCAACWVDGAAQTPARGTVALDWVVPSARADEAPLSAVARSDGADRLSASGRAVPEASLDVLSPRIRRAAGRLRVARGPALGGYVGASIEYRPGPGERAPFSAWLALVEVLPAGTEGSPVARRLVRNLLTVSWAADRSAPGAATRLFESRPMNLPEGSNPARIEVVGWIESRPGVPLAIAASACAGSIQRG